MIGQSVFLSEHQKMSKGFQPVLPDPDQQVISTPDQPDNLGSLSPSTPNNLNSSVTTWLSTGGESRFETLNLGDTEQRSVSI